MIVNKDVLPAAKMQKCLENKKNCPETTRYVNLLIKLRLISLFILKLFETSEK